MEGVALTSHLPIVVLSLSHNPIRRFEATFGPELEHVWMTATNVTCAGVELPAAVCTDDNTCDAQYGVSRLGNQVGR